MLAGVGWDLAVWGGRVEEGGSERGLDGRNGKGAGPDFLSQISEKEGLGEACGELVLEALCGGMRNGLALGGEEEEGGEGETEQAAEGDDQHEGSAASLLGEASWRGGVRCRDGRFVRGQGGEGTGWTRIKRNHAQPTFEGSRVVDGAETGCESGRNLRLTVSTITAVHKCLLHHGVHVDAFEVRGPDPLEV